MLTIGAERAFIRTRHGLGLVPRHDLASAPAPERMLIPGQPDAATAASVERWAAARLGRTAERIHAGGGFPYDLTITDLAHEETRLVARSVARSIEYPTAMLALGDRDWQPGLVVRGLALSLLGPVMLLGIARLRGRRRTMALRRQPATA